MVLFTLYYVKRCKARGVLLRLAFAYFLELLHAIFFAGIVKRAQSHQTVLSGAIVKLSSAIFLLLIASRVRRLKLFVSTRNSPRERKRVCKGSQ